MCFENLENEGIKSEDDRYCIRMACFNGNQEACRKKELIARDYEVLDASLVNRPLWTDNLESWKAQNNSNDRSQYFLEESLPLSTREVACDDAKSKVQLILNEKISNSNSNLNASILKIYWEKRDYKVNMGAKENLIAYVCYSLGSLNFK